MKKLQYGILLVILPLILAFSYYFSPSKPLSIVKDIGQLPVDAGIADVSNSIAFKGNLYFISNIPEFGAELWKADKDNNVSLALETISGRESSGIRILFESENMLYVSARKPDSNTSSVYYLDDPNGEFIELDLGVTINTSNLKEVDGKYFTLASSNGSKLDTIVEFKGVDTLVHTIIGSESNYGINDFSYFNNKIYYSVSYGLSHEIRKNSIEDVEVVYTSDHLIPKLIKTNAGIYIVENNYDVTPYSFDLSLLNQDQVIPLKSFSYIDTDKISSKGNYLTLFASSVGSEVQQIWEFNGADINQLTNYIEAEVWDVRHLTRIGSALYYYESGVEGEKVKFSDGTGLYDVSTGYEHYKLFSHTRLLELNSKVFIQGNKYQDGQAIPSMSVISNGIATEIISDQEVYEYQPFSMGDKVYVIAKKYNSVIELYEIDPDFGVANSKLVFESESGAYLAADELNNRIYILNGDTAGGQYLLSVIDNYIVSQLTVSSNTGGSYPRQFTAMKDKTYFIAEHDELGTTLWESDGYGALLINAEFNENLNLSPEMLFSVDDHLIYLVKDESGFDSEFQVWIHKEGSSQRLSEYTFKENELSILNDGSRLSFISGYEGGTRRALWSISPEEVQLIEELDSASNETKLINTLHGIYFTDGFGDSAGLWKLDGMSLIKIEDNGLQFSSSYEREIIWDSEHVYLSQCIDYTTVLYKSDITNGLEAMDIGELSGKNCNDSKYYQLSEEVAVLLSSYGTDLYGVWSLKDGALNRIDSFVDVSLEAIAMDSRLYFNAQPADSYRNYLHVYENGVASNLYIESPDGLKVAKVSTEDNSDWIFNKYVGYQLFQYSEYGLSEYGVIPDGYDNIHSIVKVGNINFIQASGQYGSNQLIALDEAGDLTFLNQDQSINFSNVSYFGGSPIGKGHREWLFMQGCNYIVGCEPYSLSLSKTLLASFKTDKSHYVAGYKVSVDGSLSEMGEADIVEYKWKLVGYEGAQIENNGNAQASIKLPLIEQSTNLTVELEVIDANDNSSTATKEISVEVNQAPEIIISSPNSAVEGSLVKLDARGSNDAEGEGLSFQWSVLEGENIVLNNTSQAVATFTVPELEQDVVITLLVTVSDAVGNISEAEVQMSLEKLEGTANPNPDNGSGDGGSGGGGSTNWLLLLMLTMIMMIRFGYYRR
ncbi:MAG TPA: hypothetical protein VIM93_09805 [Kangiella sp.]